MNNVQILTDDLMRMCENNTALFMHKNISPKLKCKWLALYTSPADVLSVTKNVQMPTVTS